MNLMKKILVLSLFALLAAGCAGPDKVCIKSHQKTVHHGGGFTHMNGYSSYQMPYDSLVEVCDEYQVINNK